jgi:hypothetical protein
MSQHTIQFSTISVAGFFLMPILAQAANLPVPFTSQAPYGNWQEPWHNACEETSIVMVDAYYHDEATLTRAKAKAEILEVFRIKNTYMSKSLDETTQTIQQLINNFLPWEATVVDRPSLAQIIAEIDGGRPVIIPVMADVLQNPHFRGTFPYHVLVISGYDDTTQEFITQEPGTRHGENYRYTYATLLLAMRDFDSVDMNRAPQRALFTSSTVDISADTDGDADGLSKEQELKYGTSLTEADTDHDGYTDGTEVQTGHSPLDNETHVLRNGSVVKTLTSSAVFLYKDKTLHAFATEKAFLSRGYRWSQIQVISPLLRDLQTRGSVLY